MDGPRDQGAGETEEADTRPLWPPWGQRAGFFCQTCMGRKWGRKKEHGGTGLMRERGGGGGGEDGEGGGGRVAGGAAAGLYTPMSHLPRSWGLPMGSYL